MKVVHWKLILGNFHHTYTPQCRCDHFTIDQHQFESVSETCPTQVAVRTLLKTGIYIMCHRVPKVSFKMLVVIENIIKHFQHIASYQYIGMYNTSPGLTMHSYPSKSRNFGNLS